MNRNIAILSGLVVLALAGCSSTDSSPYVGYTGVTTAGTVSENNAGDYTDTTVAGSGSALGGSDAGDSLFDAFLTTGQNKPTSTAGKVLHKVVPLATQSQSGSESGDCAGGGGTLNYTVTYDEATYDLDLSMTANQFCVTETDGEVTMNGGVRLIVSSGFADMTMTFTEFALTEGDVTTSLHGNMTVSTEFFSGSSTVTATLEGSDSATGEQFKMENVTIVSSSQNTTIEGRFYDPDNGYVDVTTTTAIVTDETTGNPVSGEIVLTGAGGSTATVTFVDNTSFTVVVDVDGEGATPAGAAQTVLWEDVNGAEVTPVV